MCLYLPMRGLLQNDMMTSSNGNFFRVTGPLFREFIGHRWIPLTKASDAELNFHPKCIFPKSRLPRKSISNFGSVLILLCCIDIFKRTQQSVMIKRGFTRFELRCFKIVVEHFYDTTNLLIVFPQIFRKRKIFAEVIECLSVTWQMSLVTLPTSGADIIMGLGRTISQKLSSINNMAEENRNTNKVYII